MTDLSDQPKMTLEQAKTVERTAFWVGADEEFMLDPRTGAVYWHPWLEDQPHGPHAWEYVPGGKTVPESGWIHWPSPPCDCEFCS